MSYKRFNKVAYKPFASFDEFKEEIMSETEVITKEELEDFDVFLSKQSVARDIDLKAKIIEGMNDKYKSEETEEDVWYWESRSHDLSCSGKEELVSCFLVWDAQPAVPWSEINVAWQEHLQAPKTVCSINS